MLNSATPELQIDWNTVGDEADAGGQQRVQPFAQARRRRRRSAAPAIRGSKLVISACSRVRYSGSLPTKSASCEASTGIRMTSAERQHDDEGDQDEQRRHDARQAQPLQPVGDRIEEIGEHHAGHERQQDVAEDDRGRAPRTTRGDQPEADLTAEMRRRSAASASLVIRRASFAFAIYRSCASARLRDRLRRKPRSRGRTAMIRAGAKRPEIGARRRVRQARRRPARSARRCWPWRPTAASSRPDCP